jgi:hypothetical protein
MNQFKSKLNLIKVILGMEVKMAEALLEDGTTKVVAEAFEPGMKLFVVAETGEQTPAPAGTHTLEDGTVVTVDDQGTITEVAAADAEEESKVEVEIEAAEEEIKEEVKIDGPVAEKLQEIVKEKIEEAMEKVYMALEEVVKEVTEVKEEMRSYKEKMSKTPGSKKVSTFNSEAPSNSDPIESRLEHLKELKASLGKKKNF